MIIWTDYMRFRLDLRGFDLQLLEQIINNSTERYYDTETGRYVIVGRHNKHLVLIPIDTSENDIIPVTVHATTRQQINSRIQTGRFIYE